MAGTHQSFFTFLPEPGNGQNLTLLCSRPLLDDQGRPLGTLVAISYSGLQSSILKTARSLLPGSAMLYFLEDGSLANPGEQPGLAKKVTNPELTNRALLAINNPESGSHFEVASANTPAAIGFASWMPGNKIGILLTVPRQVVNARAVFFDPTYLILLGGLVVLAGILLSILAGQRILAPIQNLVQTANNFARGNWAERARVHRNDELGQLAASFNKMADELSDYYTSLEKIVQKRTGQLRIVSEVAQLPTSAAQFNDTLRQMLDLIVSRFGFYFVAVYLLNETGRFLVLKEARGSSSDLVLQRDSWIDLNHSNLVSWAARYNQVRVTSVGSADGLFHRDELLPNTRSEIALPIAHGGEVLGVFVIHAVEPDAFDAETVSILQTLAQQVTNNFQNALLFENTRVSFQETSLLYKVTRQVAQARSEAEVVQYLTDMFIQLPLVGAILLAEEDGITFQAFTDAKTGRGEKNLPKLRFSTGQLSARLEENRSLFIEDISRPSEFEPVLSFFLLRGCTSAAFLSVLENGKLSRILAFGARDAHLITQANLQQYLNLADIIGAILEKYHVMTKLERRVSELQVLTSFSQTISVETDLNRLFQVLHEQAIQMFGSELEFAVALYDQRENMIQFPYFFEQGKLLSIPPFALGEGLTSILIQTRKPLLLADEKAVMSLTGKVLGRDAKSWMGIPLIYSGGVVGAVLIQDLDHENRFREEDVNLFNTLAPQIAIAIRNADLYTQATEALRAYDQERFLLNTLLDHIPEGITFKDARARYIRASRSVAKKFTLEPAALTGKDDRELMDATAAEKAIAGDLQVMSSGSPEIGRIERNTSPAREETWTQISRLPITDSAGGLFGLLTIQQDVTGLKQAEALAQRRADQVMTAAEIARDTSGTLDVDSLLQKSVTLIRERFGFYHASLFLTGPAREYAELRAATGLAGEKMLQSGYRLAVGSKSIVGQVAATAKPLVVNDVRLDSTFLFDPLLPATQSELAIPLLIGQRLVGVLDVQSMQLDAFQPDDVNVLQILADQLAVALSNAGLFAETQELLVKHRLLRHVSIAASSSTNLEDALTNVVSGLLNAKAAEQIAILLLNEDRMLQVGASAGYHGTRHLEVRLALGQGISGQAAQEKRAIRVDDPQKDPRYINIEPGMRSELAVPILFGDEVLGVLNLESSQVAAFNENDQEIISALGSNLGGVIANIRLVNRIRQQIERERQLFDAASKIRRSVDLETILETATQEICRATGASRARIRITAGKSPQEAQPAARKNGNSNGHEGRQ
jgi:PAS domain S-box-containing protein